MISGEFTETTGRYNVHIKLVIVVNCSWALIQSCMVINIFTDKTDKYTWTDSEIRSFQKTIDNTDKIKNYLSYSNTLEHATETFCQYNQGHYRRNLHTVLVKTY